MTSHRSAEDVEAEHIRAMGGDLGPVYHALSNDVTWLHAKWAQYRQLFAKSERRIDLLNKAAGHFFRILQDTLFEEVILHIARLTGPQKSVGKENLTLQQLPSLAPPELQIEMKALLEKVLTVCKVTSDWRNKRLAHLDLKVALATSADPIPGISRANIEVALDTIRRLLHRLELHYWNSETYYQMLLTQHGEADDFVFYLQEGLNAVRAKQERLRTGQALPEDIAPPEEV